MMTGVATLRHRDMPFDAILFLDADLGDTAALASALVAPVLSGTADLTIAVPRRPGRRPAASAWSRAWPGGASGRRPA